MSTIEEAAVERADALELISSAADWVALSAEAKRLEADRKKKRDLVVRLARRLTSDGSLNDEEAVKAATSRAFDLLGVKKG